LKAPAFRRVAADSDYKHFSYLSSDRALWTQNCEITRVNPNFQVLLIGSTKVRNCARNVTIFCIKYRAMTSSAVRECSFILRENWATAMSSSKSLDSGGRSVGRSIGLLASVRGRTNRLIACPPARPPPKGYNFRRRQPPNFRERKKTLGIFFGARCSKIGME
jgi:hypothetical protein